MACGAAWHRRRRSSNLIEFQSTSYSKHSRGTMCPRLFLSLRSLKVLDPKIEKLGSERIGPDEAFHRDFLTAWWHRRLAGSSGQERADILGHMREQDGAYRQRKAAYYESLIRRMSDFGAWSYEQTRPI